MLDAPAPKKQPLMAEQTYTITELSREFGITTRTIRYYEEKALIHPQRQGQTRLYSNADRVRIKLILRGKRIGMTLEESVSVIDLYDPNNNNATQLQALVATVQERRATLLQQKADIDDTLSSLGEVEQLCSRALQENPLLTDSPDS